jgi:hypothetical protein
LDQKELTQQLEEQAVRQRHREYHPPLLEESEQFHSRRQEEPVVLQLQLGLRPPWQVEQERFRL